LNRSALNPLKGKLVIDTTRLLPGGYCSMVLADLGAEVVKVEQPGLGDYMRLTPPLKEGKSIVHHSVNRNKKSIALDLKKEEGRKILEKLVKKADIFLEGFRPGVMEKLGFSYKKVSRLNKRIIYCSISSFGRKSNLSKLPGHDINFQAAAGTIEYSKPEVPLVQLADISSALFSCIAILASLSSKKRPIFIEIPIVQSLLSLLVIPLSSYFASGKIPFPGHSLVFGSGPRYRLYRTLDGRYFALGAIEEKFMKKFLELSGIDGSISEEDLSSKIESFIASRSFESLIDFACEETCFTPVLRMSESINSDWAIAYRMIQYVEGLPIINTPFGNKMHKKAPEIGEDTEQILISLGYKKNDIEELRKRKVIS
jgi:crotonobetainyl-CoA:carnitine CoA-transferase CaiB-like acyl-CoA transferase